MFIIRVIVFPEAKDPDEKRLVTVKVSKAEVEVELVMEVVQVGEAPEVSPDATHELT